MKGINGKPYIALDSVVDLGLLNIEEIEIGLAVAPGRIMNYFGMGTDPTYDDLSFYLKNKPAGLSTREEMLWASQNERPNFWRMYAKLKYGAFSGSWVVPLTMARPQAGVDRYHMNADANAFMPITEHLKLFPSVQKFMDSGYFESIGRVTFFVQDHYVPLPMHSDNPELQFTNVNRGDANIDFIWVSPKQEKSFFVYDQAFLIVKYVKSGL